MLQDHSVPSFAECQQRARDALIETGYYPTPAGIVTISRPSSLKSNRASSHQLIDQLTPPDLFALYTLALALRAR
jgi:hypothetical protein